MSSVCKLFSSSLTLAFCNFCSLFSRVLLIIFPQMTMPYWIMLCIWAQYMTLSACLLSSLLPLFSMAFLLVIRKTSLSTWVFQLRFWSTHVPRNLAVSSIGIWNEFSSILMFGFVPFGLNNSPTVFSMFKVNLFHHHSSPYHLC